MTLLNILHVSLKTVAKHLIELISHPQQIKG